MSTISKGEVVTIDNEDRKPTESKGYYLVFLGKYEDNKKPVRFLFTEREINSLIEINLEGLSLSQGDVYKLSSLNESAKPRMLYLVKLKVAGEERCCKIPSTIMKLAYDRATKQSDGEGELSTWAKLFG